MGGGQVERVVMRGRRKAGWCECHLMNLMTSVGQPHESMRGVRHLGKGSSRRGEEVEEGNKEGKRE